MMSITKVHPSDFERRILLTLAGHSPAIITETLYALTQQQQPAYIPTEIQVITTDSGKEKLLNTLLKSQIIQQFCQDYKIDSPILFNEQCIHVITDKNGQVLPDLKKDQDNESAADFISHLVRDFTRDPDSSLHTSIAGGRKTMTYYLGYAMSIFGRIQDRMSHVLLNPEPVPNSAFYYPRPLANPAAAAAPEPQVTLGELPFIRLREGLGFIKELSNSQKDLSFNAVVRAVQNQFEGTSVELTEDNQLYANQILIKHRRFTGTDLAVYIWFLTRHYQGKPPVCYQSKDDNGNLVYAEELLAVYRQLFGDKGIKKMEDSIETKGLDLVYLRPHISNCNKALEVSLSREAALRKYCIQTNEANKGQICYFLADALMPEHINLGFPIR
jgi:CRISPR-associated protein (TIGR02584 family)